MENKYYEWLVGNRKHFPKMDLPEVPLPQIPMTEKDWQELRDKEIEHDSVMDAMEEVEIIN